MQLKALAGADGRSMQLKAVTGANGRRMQLQALTGPYGRRMHAVKGFDWARWQAHAVKVTSLIASTATARAQLQGSNSVQVRHTAGEKLQVKRLLTL